ncbi:MAG: sigma 54-interacting transcriptional regulator [Bacillota bacterium]|nr:sigma 54-interacting transcriptional regulator [Bacillota bacterium]
MAGRVALVLRSPGLRAAASQLLAETGEDALVYAGAEFHPERVVSRALEEGAAVMVAPPPLARGLRQVGLLPVVEVEATSFELLEALGRARQGGRPIVLVHYSRAGPDAGVLSQVAGVPVTCLSLPRDAGKVREHLEKVAPGSVVVGGETTVSLAAGLGLAGVAVTPGKAALEEALKRARAVLAALGQATGGMAGGGGLDGPAGAGGGDGPRGPGDMAPQEIPVREGEEMRPPWEEVVAGSPAMDRAVALARQIAASLRPALVWGELGAGKSFMCAYMHCHGPLAGQQLVVVSCGGSPHALKDRLGRVTDKGNSFQGTLVLEQVEELPPEWQASLLGLLEQEEGGVRVLATTRGKLKQAVDEGRFREDLYWRLSELQLRVPPLRERLEDLEPLLAAFWTELAGQPLDLTAPGRQRLLRYRWPGNVRELRNFAHRYFLLWKGLPLFPPEEREKMALDDFLSAVEEESLRVPIQVVPGTMESMQAQIMHEMARRIKGSKAEVARRLGISRTTLWKRLKEAGRATAGGEGIS